MDKIICIAGPTASGKTALAVSMAAALDGEVVSCDSMQVYKYMDIGTAKPTQEEMQGIRHHMLSVADPREDFSVSMYCAMATPIVDDILSRGKTAIIAGGTGLYMDALIRGNSFAPCPSTGMREKLEAQADAQGMKAMLDLLQSVDPQTAERMHLADRKRILRALEVYYETGETITAHNLKTQAIPPRYQPIWIALEDEDRQTLYDRINRRVNMMISDGLLDEIQGLLAQGINPRCTAMQAIGYKEFFDVISGKSPLSEAVAQTQQASRRYAKRQLTWFHRNSSIHWIRRAPSEENEEILAKARQILAEFDN